MNALPAYRPLIESWTGVYVTPAPVTAAQLEDATGDLLDLDRLPTLWDALHLDPTPWDALLDAVERLVALYADGWAVRDRAHLGRFTGLAAADTLAYLRRAADALRERDRGWAAQFIYNAWQAYDRPAALAA